MKILLLKPSSLGDVVQALPVARLIKQHQPDAEIHWWLNRELVPLLEGDPDLSRVIPFDRARWGRIDGWPLIVSEIRALRRERYDWVVDLQSLARSALVAWLSRGRFTVGLDDRREGAPLFYDVAVPRPAPDAHAVDWYLSVLPRLGVPVHSRFEWLPPRPTVARELLARFPDLETQVWIGVQPGARWMNKRWPLEHFIELSRRLLASGRKVRLAVLGGHSDQPLGAAIAAGAGDGVLDLTGRLSLSEMVEWLRRCAVMVTNDTGPMHVAAALGRPVVALFGPTNPARTGPYGGQHRVLKFPVQCAPCMRSRCHWSEPLACLRGIQPAAVAETVRALLPRDA